MQNVKEYFLNTESKTEHYISHDIVSYQDLKFIMQNSKPDHRVSQSVSNVFLALLHKQLHSVAEQLKDRVVLLVCLPSEHLSTALKASEYYESDQNMPPKIKKHRINLCYKNYFEITNHTAAKTCLRDHGSQKTSEYG